MKTFFKDNYTIFLVIIIFFLIGCFNLSKNYTYDTVGFALSIKNNNFHEIFHPYHLIYTFIWFIFYKITSGTLSILVSGQIFSLICGSLNSLIFYLCLKKLLNSKKIALCFTLVYLFSLWHWYYSLDAEVHTLNGLNILLLFYVLITYIKKNNIINLYLLTFLQGFAILVHQTNLLFILIVIPAIYIFSGKKIKNIFIFCVGVFLIVFIPYFIVVAGVNKITSPAAAYKWLTKYQQLGYWKNITQNYYTESFKGFSYALFGGGYKKYLLTQILFYFTLAYLILFFKLLKRRTEIVVIILWFILFSAVVVYWHPLNYENWNSIIPFLMLLSFVIDDMTDRLNNIFIKRFINTAVIFFTVVMGIVIYISYINYYSKVENNINLKKVKEIESKIDKKSFVIGLGEGDFAVANVYFPYFTNVEFTSLAIVLYKNKSNYMKSMNYLKDLIDKKISSSYHVYVLDEVYTNKDAIKKLADMHHIRNGMPFSNLEHLDRISSETK